MTNTQHAEIIVDEDLVIFKCFDVEHTDLNELLKRCKRFKLKTTDFKLFNETEEEQ
mgnify:CR=1 FL=1